MEQELINQWVRAAHQVAQHRWPVVDIPLPPRRKIGENAQASTSLYWPGKDGREGVEYVLEIGPRGQHHYWIGNATVKFADPQAVRVAISECQQAAERIHHLTAAAQMDKKYRELSDITNALVLAGRVHPESIDELGEFRALVPICYEIRQIASKDWAGSRVRNLVESLMDGGLFYSEVTVTHENGRLTRVKARLYPEFFIVFHFWGKDWTSLADCWFGVPEGDCGIQAIGESYRDQVWHVSHVCKSPAEALALLDILTAVKRFLGWEE